MGKEYQEGEENEEKSTGGEAGRMVERNSSIHRSQMF